MVKLVTIDDIVEQTCMHIVREKGCGCVVSRMEICQLARELYSAKVTSVMPSDYCYNRINDGITRSKRMLFEYLGAGRYRCLGAGYAFDGLVYHRFRGERKDCRGRQMRERMSSTLANGNKVVVPIHETGRAD